MKIYLILFVFVTSLIYAAPLARGTDPIHDEYVETNRFSIHSEGLLSYGAHTNTFHIRYAFIRCNLNFGNFRLFSTINGYKDTHNPALTYTYSLYNINLYDYGVRYQLPAHFFLSLRGAAVFRKNTDTFLLIPHYYYDTDPAEFDSPEVYRKVFINAAGIRAGYFDNTWTIAYSQGDYRHSIPMAGIVKFQNSSFYIRGIIQLQNANPLVYSFDLYRADFEISAALNVAVKYGTLLFLAEGNNSALTKETRLRFEAGYNYKPWTVASRAMMMFDKNGVPQMLFEGSVDFAPSPKLTRIGVFASSDGRIYIASKIDF